MKQRINYLIVILFSFNLAGCLTTLEVAALSGASYLITGKSLTDNAVSAALDQDCALHKLVTEGEYCQAQSAYMVAKNDNKPAVDTKNTEQINNTQLQESNTSLLTDKVTVVAQEVSFQVEEQQAQPHLLNQAEIFAVVGSFNNKQFAAERREIYADYNALIIESHSGANPTYRVIVGPYSDTNFLSKIPTKVGIETALPWALRLCSQGLTPPPCDNAMIAKL